MNKRKIEVRMPGAKKGFVTDNAATAWAVAMACGLEMRNVVTGLVGTPDRCNGAPIIVWKSDCAEVVETLGAQQFNYST
jgi:hypothetical protein